MKSIKDIAKYINTNKPDISKFLSVLVEDTFNAPKLIEAEQNSYVQALMAEIYMCYCKTHSRIWIGNLERHTIHEIYIKLVMEAKLSSPGSSNYWTFERNYSISNSFDESLHILAHIEEVRKYLPKYLWDKVRTKKESVKAALKQLGDNPLSLKAFETYLKSVKKLTSVQAEEYLNQIVGFSLQEKFMDLIFSKCTPSEKLQKSLSNYKNQNQNSNKVSKYMYLNKCLMQYLVNRLNLPMFYELFDDRYSDYKPFITNVPRNINKNPQQLNYLYGCLVTFKVANSLEPNEVYQHFIKHLEEHLNHPDLQEELTKIKNNLSVLKQFI